MKQRIVTTLVVAFLLGVAMLGLRHIDRLNDGIELKKIELRDNSARLKLLDNKYIELNKELDKTGADKQKLEQELKQLQEERQKLQEALQAKQKAKERDLAVKAQRAVTGTSVASATTGSCAEWMAAAGIPSTEATNKLILKESGCNPRAVNPTSGACGIPQAYPCSKLPQGVNTDPVTQLQWMQSYVTGRYGSWENALSMWYSRCGSAQGCWY